jgi:hypothetical protein
LTSFPKNLFLTFARLLKAEIERELCQVFQIFFNCQGERMGYTGWLVDSGTKKKRLWCIYSMYVMYTGCSKKSNFNLAFCSLVDLILFEINKNP